jgi:hypothetical protein
LLNWRGNDCCFKQKDEVKRLFFVNLSLPWVGATQYKTVSSGGGKQTQYNFVSPPPPPPPPSPGGRRERKSKCASHLVTSLISRH